MTEGGVNMGKLRVHNLAVSLDGYAAGPDQSRQNGLGVGGESLHDWYVPTQTFRQAHGSKGGGETEELMIDATHLKAHRTAASLLKKGLYPGISDARRAV